MAYVGATEQNYTLCPRVCPHTLGYQANSTATNYGLSPIRWFSRLSGLHLSLFEDAVYNESDNVPYGVCCRTAGTHSATQRLLIKAWRTALWNEAILFLCSAVEKKNAHPNSFKDLWVSHCIIPLKQQHPLMNRALLSQCWSVKDVSKLCLQWTYLCSL